MDTPLNQEQSAALAHCGEHGHSFGDEARCECCGWPADQIDYNRRQRIAELERFVERLKATLDGDPEQTSTPEQRRAWRLSAVRYADKLEAEVEQLRLERDNSLIIATDTLSLVKRSDLVKTEEIKQLRAIDKAVRELREHWAEMTERDSDGTRRRFVVELDKVLYGDKVPTKDG